MNVLLKEKVDEILKNYNAKFSTNVDVYMVTKDKYRILGIDNLSYKNADEIINAFKNLGIHYGCEMISVSHDGKKTNICFFNY